MTLKEARERLGKTQAQMAEMLGVSRNYLALIESGKRPEQPDLLQRALLIVNKASKELSLEEWKARALAAEEKLASLRRMAEAMISSFQ